MTKQEILETTQRMERRSREERRRREEHGWASVSRRAGIDRRAVEMSAALSGGKTRKQIQDGIRVRRVMSELTQASPYDDVWGDAR